METILAVVKVVSAAAGMAFGIYGLGVEFRHREGSFKGHLTREGLTALGGIVLSGLLAISAVVIDAYIQREAAKQAQKRAEGAEKEMKDILGGVRNGIYSMREMSVTFEIEIVLKDSSYIDRIKGILDGVTLDQCRDWQEKDSKCRYLAASKRSHARVEGFQISEKSALYPGNGPNGAVPNELPLSRMLHDLSGVVAFTKKPLTIDKDGQLDVEGEEVDMDFSQVGSTERALFYDVKAKNLIITLVFNDYSDEKGKAFTRSLVEFEGGGVAAGPWLSGSCHPGDVGAACKEVLDLLTRSEMKSLILEIPYRKIIIVRKHDNNVFNIGGVTHGLFRNFPTNVDDL